MANDSSLRSSLEQWFADQLAALTFEGKKVFNEKGADVWKHQIRATEGGIEGFTQFAPFAFCSVVDTDGQREGGYDLKEVIEIVVFIGVESKYPGDARTGNATQLGTNKICEFVIALFDKHHPDNSLTCDEIYYMRDLEVIDTPLVHAREIHFEVSFLHSE